MTDLILARINCPSAAVADAITQSLLDAKLSPCTNREGPVFSSYVWEGRIERAEEWVLWVKAPAYHWGAIKTLARAQHPDSVPAIMAMPIEAATPDFAQWIVDNTAPRTR